MNWPSLLRAGLCGLRLAPDAFWALTPMEFAMLLGHGPGAGTLSRARLEELARAYPDQRGTTDHE